ncbi:MAG TPA: N-acetyl-gamma-glutamyl-phosphate reductase [Eubacteriaceae bacterium]|nr:N-acetyl-gamma-glutamyl-phosphate reductase [Eubacteriaceae bacterium]
MIRASVIGASGYVGQELIRLLIKHPEVTIDTITSPSQVGEAYHKLYGNYCDIFQDKFQTQDIKRIAATSDVVFLALPHGVTSGLVDEEILKKVKVIDMGADYRLNDVNIYEQWYGVKHESPQLMEESVYGLCELHRKKVASARLVANPGCYTTCSILSLAPLLTMKEFDSDGIVIDAKSGVTGAGRGVSLGTHYNETNENIKAYKIAGHRHTPEIEQELSLVGEKPIQVLFTPHLIPMNRGILATCYVPMNSKTDEGEIRKRYQAFYKDEPFVRVLQADQMPETRWVKGSNYCDINVKVDERTNRLIVVGAIDNLMKGAASQGIQNMNVLFGLNEETGISDPPIFPV